MASTKTTTTEKWKPVIGYEGWYEVSSRGHVKRIRGGSGSRAGQKLAVRLSRHGYPRASLSRKNKVKDVKVHHLVLEAFVGPMPQGKVCNHKDGNKQNNHVDNLEWVTPAENIRHANDILMVQHGERNSRAVFTENDVVEIRSLARQGLTSRAISARFGARNRQIRKIVSGEQWPHIPGATGKRPITKKLTESLVRQIRQAISDGETHCSVSTRFGIATATVSQIRNLKTWRHIV
jgi:hypothetical protein